MQSNRPGGKYRGRQLTTKTNSINVHLKKFKPNGITHENFTELGYTINDFKCPG